MKTQTKTIEDFISKHQIEADVIPAHANPTMDDEWAKTARHWSVKLHQVGRGNDKYIVTPFSQGSAHKKKPTAADALDCLAMDSSCIESEGCFDYWAMSLGYDVDSRKALDIYNACLEQSKQLKDFLGIDAYNELLNDVERL